MILAPSRVLARQYITPSLSHDNNRFFRDVGKEKPPNSNPNDDPVIMSSNNFMELIAADQTNKEIFEKINKFVKSLEPQVIFGNKLGKISPSERAKFKRTFMRTGMGYGIVNAITDTYNSPLPPNKKINKIKSLLINNPGALSCVSAAHAVGRIGQLVGFNSYIINTDMKGFPAGHEFVVITDVELQQTGKLSGRALVDEIKEQGGSFMTADLWCGGEGLQMPESRSLTVKPLKGNIPRAAKDNVHTPKPAM